MRWILSTLFLTDLLKCFEIVCGTGAAEISVTSVFTGAESESKNYLHVSEV